MQAALLPSPQGALVSKGANYALRPVPCALYCPPVTPSNRRWAAALAAAMLAFVSPLGAQAPAGTTVVTGRVVAEGSGQPVRRAYVIVHGPGTKTTRVTMSDLEGGFRFEGLPDDRYRVGASKQPFLSAAVDAADAGVLLTLRPGAIITGTLVDPGGVPLALDVNLSSRSLAGVMTTIAFGGVYRFHGLPPGEYTITVPRRKTDGRQVIVGEDQLGRELQVPALTVPPVDGPPPPFQQDIKEGTGVISGMVRDVTSNMPLADITVALQRSTRRAVTDATGRFQFTGLGPATYGFRVDHPGYAPTSSATVQLPEAGQISDVSIAAGRLGSIAGTVRDDVGDPVIGMPVRAFRKQVLNFTPMLMPRGDSRTDDRGAFHLRGLQPGDYLLCACAGEPLPIDPLLLRQLGPTAPDAATVSRLIDDTVQTFAPAYFPGVTRQVDSQLISVEFSDDRTAMDLTMYGVKPFAISGRMIESGGPPSQAMQLFLSQDGDLPGSVGVNEMRPVELSPDGRFRFTGVAPGTYAVAAVPVAQNVKGPSGFQAVTITDGDVENVAVTLGNGLTLAGRVEFSGSAPRPSMDAMPKTRVGLFPLDLSVRLFVSMGTSGSVGSSAFLDQDGGFTMDGVAPGRYLVSVSVPDSPWRTIQRVMSADAEVSGNVLTVGEAGAGDVLVVVTDTPLATLEGTVELARYESPGATRVVMFPTNADLWREPEQHSQQFPSTFVSPKHTISIPNLPAGDYYVAIVSTFDYEMSARSLERWAKTAQRVTLVAGQTTTVSVKR